MNEQSLFLDALEHPAGNERRQWLADACDDEALRVRVVALLEQHESGSEFLDRPALDRLVSSEGSDEGSGPAKRRPTSKTDQQITKKKFVERLVRSKLMTAEEVAACEAESSLLREANDAQSYAQAMVRSKRLTKFQARAIYSGRIKGLTFGEYVILDQLGRGGMGIVYKAQHRRMERLVAIKVLPRVAMSTKGAIDRFYREVRAAAKLMHPNIVAALDASEDDGLHYLVMEYVEGQDLGEMLQADGALTLEAAVNCIIQAARGLQFAHNQGVIHRDIKPANLLVDSNGTVKILDMGLARVINATEDEQPMDESHAAILSAELPSSAVTMSGFNETVSLDQATAKVNDETRLTRAGEVMGTLDYMPPEQFTNTRTVDERGDIYSLGCTLYRILADERPFPLDTVGEIYEAHQSFPIPSLRAACPAVPTSLDVAFQKMMAKEPEQRQSSMTQVIEELEAALKEERIPTPAEDEFLPSVSTGAGGRNGGVASPVSRRSPKRLPLRAQRLNLAVAAGLAICFLLLVGMLVVWNLPPRDQQLANASNEDSVGETNSSRRGWAEAGRGRVDRGPEVNPESDNSSGNGLDEANGAGGAADVAGQESGLGPETDRGRSQGANKASLGKERAAALTNGSDGSTGRSAASDAAPEKAPSPLGSLLPEGMNFGSFANRHMSFMDNGKRISVTENDKGISVTINDRVVTAKDSKELKDIDIEAYRFYEKAFSSPPAGGLPTPSTLVPNAKDLQLDQLEELLEQHSDNPQMRALIEGMLDNLKGGSK